MLSRVSRVVGDAGGVSIPDSIKNAFILRLLNLEAYENEPHGMMEHEIPNRPAFGLFPRAV